MHQARQSLVHRYILSLGIAKKISLKKFFPISLQLFAQPISAARKSRSLRYDYDCHSTFSSGREQRLPVADVQ